MIFFLQIIVFYQEELKTILSPKKLQSWRKISHSFKMNKSSHSSSASFFLLPFCTCSIPGLSSHAILCILCTTFSSHHNPHHHHNSSPIPILTSLPFYAPPTPPILILIVVKNLKIIIDQCNDGLWVKAICWDCTSTFITSASLLLSPPPPS